LRRAVGKTRDRSNPQGMESRLHLLLLEDDQQLRTALESLLVDEGYEVATAADGREAVAQAANQAPDILLLDVKLPGPDGLEVLKQLKQQLPELQSLVMTGYASEEDSIRAIRLGVGDYLQKPFPMADFLQAVESLTRRALRLKALREKEEAARDVAPADVAASIVCGPEPEPYLREIRGCFEAGFDAVALHQIGPDQSGFLNFWQTSLRPALELSQL